MTTYAFAGRGVNCHSEGLFFGVLTKQRGKAIMVSTFIATLCQGGKTVCLKQNLFHLR
jgi:hypothetical protein